MLSLCHSVPHGLPDGPQEGSCGFKNGEGQLSPTSPGTNLRIPERGVTTGHDVCPDVTHHLQDVPAKRLTFCSHLVQI